MGIHMLGTPERKETEYNMTFGLLAGLAIIMVVAGHLGYEIMTFGGLFPYYSFHVPLFLFVSGYFYQGSAEEHPIPYLKKKIRRLLMPYFIWNLLYGLFAWLLRAKGFCMGDWDSDVVFGTFSAWVSVYLQLCGVVCAGVVCHRSDESVYADPDRESPANAASAEKD